MTVRKGIVTGVLVIWILAHPMLGAEVAPGAPHKGAGELNVLVLGDWGDGGGNQRKVAETMAAFVEKQGPMNAVLTVGDNFYPSLKQGDNTDWDKLFERVYDPRRLNVPFYAVLGNHDYEKKKDLIQLEYAARNPQSRFKLPARWYRLELPADKPLVTLLMLDSNKTLSAQQQAEQRTWLEQELTRQRATRWLCVVQHHPLFSNGTHGDEKRVQQAWGSLIQKQNVDILFCGHDHSMQHLRVKNWTTDFVVAGGGGARLTTIKRSDRGPFGRSINGFAHAKFTASAVEVSLIHGITGQVVHQFTRTPEGESKVVKTTPSDKPALAKVDTPAHRAISADGQMDFKEMSSILSFSATGRGAFDKAVKSGDPAEVMRSLSLPQVQRWAGYRLYCAVIDTFRNAALNHEQKQQAFAACVALASAQVGPRTIEKNLSLEPEQALIDQATHVIREQVLSTKQREMLAAPVEDD